VKNGSGIWRPFLDQACELSRYTAGVVVIDSKKSRGWATIEFARRKQGPQPGERSKATAMAPRRALNPPNIGNNRNPLAGGLRVENIRERLTQGRFPKLVLRAIRRNAEGLHHPSSEVSTL